MQFTNKLGLPEPDFKALCHDSYHLPAGHISITQLIAPPRKVLLERAHDHEIVVDAHERMRLMLGTAVHEYVERHDGHEYLAEERIAMDVFGWTVSGRFDLYDARRKIVFDRKCTSVFSFLLGEKQEWVQQLNCYAHLLRFVGFPVEDLQITAYLIDWQGYQAKLRPEYPQHCIQLVKAPLWTPHQAQGFLEERVSVHRHAQLQMLAGGEDALPPCSPQERWERPTQWAVRKQGNKRAYRKFETLHEAKECRSSIKDGRLYDIDERPGQSTRCLRFCNANTWCSQYAAMPHPEEED